MNVWKLGQGVKKCWNAVRMMKLAGRQFLGMSLLLGLCFPVYQIALAVETPPAAPIQAVKTESAVTAAGKITHQDLVLYQPKDVTDAQVQSISQALDDGNFQYRALGLAELQTRDLQSRSGRYLFLPLFKGLTDEELQALTRYVTQGGKIILLPPEDLGNANIRQLFALTHLPVDTVSFASQSLDLKWGKKAAGTGVIKGSMPVSSQLLGLKAAAPGAPQPKVLAMWGEDFPAVVQSDRAVLFNWSWGQELSTETNDAVLSEVAGLHPGKASVEDNAVQKTPGKSQGADPTFSFLDTGLSDPDRANGGAFISPGQYHRELKTLQDYRHSIDDALETALLLEIQLPIKQIQQKMLVVDLEKTKFEHAYLVGDFYQAQKSYRMAKKLLGEATISTSPSPRIEGRAIWLDRGTIVESGSPQGLKKVLEKLNRAGINVIYFETVNAGFAVYPSKLTRQNPMVDGWDPLATAVKEGHRLGMEVHAWVWCFAVGNKRHNPIIGKPLDYPGPILSDNQLMDEALRGTTGNLLPGGKQYEYWLSPASPKGRKFLTDLYSEVVTNYDVDGLQLDYIRYPFQKPGSTMGYEPVGRQRFTQSTGLSLDSMSDHTYRVWVAWKTYQVSSFVKEISEKLKAIKPNLKLSAAVFPLPRAARIVAIQQDWETWIDNGWIDTLSPMSYTTSPAALQKIFESVEDSPKRRPLVYPGIAIHKLDAEELLRQLEALRAKGALGSTIFAMAHLDEAKIEALADGPYKEKSILSPHKDPVQATLWIVNDYQAKFTRLLKNQELNDLTGEQRLALQTQLSAFDASMRQLKDSIQTDSSITAAKLNLAQLSVQTDHWLLQEKLTHPYRAEYFNELMLRMQQMVAYLSDNYKAKKEMENLAKTPAFESVKMPAANSVQTEPAADKTATLEPSKDPSKSQTPDPKKSD